MWPFKKKVPPVEMVDDLDEAQEIRDEAQREMFELNTQKNEVRNLVYRLARRREKNHFGDELTVSFRPRGMGS